MAKTKKRERVCRALDQPHVIASDGFVCTYVHRRYGHRLLTCLEHRTAVDNAEYSLTSVLPVEPSTF